MNLTTSIFLINRDVRAVMVKYDPNKPASLPNGASVGDPAMHKTLDQTIKVGDYVVIPTLTRHKMTVGKVVEVDVSVDFDSLIPANWIISRVDPAPYEATVKLEAEAIETIKKAEFARKRRELFSSVASSQEEVDMIKALPIYKNGDALKAE